jgi:hypothetical protein
MGKMIMVHENRDSPSQKMFGIMKKFLNFWSLEFSPMDL